MKKNYITLQNHAIVNPFATASALRNEWDSIQDKGDDLTGLLERCVRKVAKTLGIDPKEVYKEYGDYVGEVWIDLYGRFSNLGDLADKLGARAARGKNTVTLTTVICQSANAVLTRDYRERKKRSKFDSIDELMESGFEGAAFAEDIFDDAFFTGLSIDALLNERPERQGEIWGMILDEYRAKEISERTGISEDTVYREKKKFQKAARNLFE